MQLTIMILAFILAVAGGAFIGYWHGWNRGYNFGKEDMRRTGWKQV